MGLFLLLVILGTSFPAAAGVDSVASPAGAPFEASRCARYFASPSLLDAEVLARANAVLRWIALADPALGRAFGEASQDDRHNLAHVTLGFAVSPEGGGWAETTTNQRAFAGVVRFTSAPGVVGRYFVNNLGTNRMRRERDWLVEKWATSPDEDRKRTLTAFILASSAATLELISAPAAREVTNLPNYPKVRFEMTRTRPDQIVQQVSVTWGKTFSTADLEHLRLLRWYLEDEAVSALVFRTAYENLGAIVSRHQTVSAYQRMEYNASYVRGEFERLTDPNFLVDVLPEKSDAAPSAPVADEVPAVSPPALAAPPNSPPHFDDAAITAFVSAPRAPLVTKLDHAELTRAWQNLQRVGELLNDALLQLDEVVPSRRNWTEWARRARASAAIEKELNADLVRATLQTTETLLPLHAAGRAFGLLNEYVASERQRWDAFDKSEAEIKRLSAHEAELLDSAITYIENLTMLAKQTLASVRIRQNVAVKQIEELALVRTLVAQVVHSRLRGDDASARERLRAALDDLAEHP